MSNFTSPSGVVQVEHLLSYANEVTSGLYVPTLILMVWVISFSGFKIHNKTPESFSGASFITAVTSVLLFFAGLLSETYLSITILLLAIAVIFLGRK